MLVINLISGLELQFYPYVFEDKSEKFGDHATYLHIGTTVKTDGFSGRTDFWASIKDINEFIEELKEFDTEFKNQVRVDFGWGENVLFSIVLFSYDNQGHLGVRVHIAKSVEGRSRKVKKQKITRKKFELSISEESYNHVVVESEVEVSELAKFFDVFKKLTLSDFYERLER